MDKIPASVAMLTYNSGKTLRRALESVKDFDDIVLYDGDSTDDTHAIAAEYGARVLRQDMKYRYENGKLADGGRARNAMMEATKHDWYLWIDSDETVSEGLRDDVARVARAPHKEGDPLAYRIPIGIIMDGRVIKYSSNYPGYQFRFFNKTSGGHLVKRAHNRIEFNQGTRIGTLRHPWYIYFSLSDHRMFSEEKKHYRRVEIEDATNRPFWDFMKNTVYFHLRASFALFVRACYVYLRHGFRDSMPLRIEVSRVLSPLILVVRVSAERLRRLFRTSHQNALKNS